MATLEECLRAIQRKCLDCCGGSREEVAACDLSSCALYLYRLGERQGNLLNQPDPEVMAAQSRHAWSREKTPGGEKQASLLE